MSSALICRHCGMPALPVDPGWTIAEAAKMLRLSSGYVSNLLSAAPQRFSEPRYRTLARGRSHRILTAGDVQALEAIVFSNGVKRFLNTCAKGVIPKRQNQKNIVLASSHGYR